MAADTSSERDRKRQRSWFASMNISLLLSLGVGLSVLGASLVVGFFAFRLLREHKMTDTWAIMFLELERQGMILSDSLAASIKLGQRPDAEYIWNSHSHRLELVSGPLPRRLQLKDLGMEPEALSVQWPDLMVIQIDGEKFLAQSRQESLLARSQMISLWSLNSKVFSRLLGAKSSRSGNIYIMTREGRVIASTSSSITVANVAGRPLVQQFIRSPLTRGEMEFRASSGEEMFGFFYEIPRSNILLFSEVEKSAVVAAIYKALSQFLMILGGIIATTLLVMQLPLRRVTGPLKEMASLALKLGQGDFSVRTSGSAFGELQILSNAFTTMTENLIARDESIRRLMREHDLKVRMEGELEIARQIQGNLLPDSKISRESGLEVEAIYLPAGECAGDWYSHHYNPKSGESVLVIVDVSGHGAGSSMFTAMIAGLFHQYKERLEDHFPVVEFTQSANKVIGGLGKGAWHATMTIITHRKGSSKIDVLFAGHTPAFYYHGSDKTKASSVGKMLQKGSQPLGLINDFQIVTGQYDFPSGSGLILYTDGLTEAKNRSGKMWGTRSLREAFVAGRYRRTDQNLREILDLWEDFRNGEPLHDDACVVMVRAL